MSKILLTIVILSILYQVQTRCPYSNLNKGKCPFSFKAKTAEGCECKTECGANPSIEKGHCDVCLTKGNCGRNSNQGKYAHCTYPQNYKYERLSAQQKLAYLWANCEKVQKVGAKENLDKFFASSMQPSFDAYLDVMPEGRLKNIRAVGSVCKFSFEVSEDSPYTGVLRAGTEAHGIIRLSWPSLKDGLVPGVGVKFLRSRVHSGNFVAVESSAPLPNDSFNWFERPLRNKFPLNAAKAKLIKKFSEASQCPYQVGLSDICKYRVNGRRERRIVFPFEIELATADIDNFPSKRMSGGELFRRIEEIPVGSSIYEVRTYRTPADKKNGRYQVLGEIVTESKCIKSEFGDAKLFFRHQRIEEDWQLRPHWLREIDPKQSCNAKHLVPKVLVKKCPQPRII